MVWRDAEQLRGLALVAAGALIDRLLALAPELPRQFGGLTLEMVRARARS